MPPRLLQQHHGARHVRLHKHPGRINRPVHMRLGRQMNHTRRVVPVKQLAHECGITNAPLHKVMAGMGTDVVERIQIPGVGQRIKRHYPVLRPGHEQAHQRRADEAGPTRHQEGGELRVRVGTGGHHQSVRDGGHRVIAMAATKVAIVCATSDNVCNTDDEPVRSPLAGTTTVAPGRGVGSSVISQNRRVRLSILPLG